MHETSSIFCLPSYTGSTTFVRRPIMFFIDRIGESRMTLNIDYTTVKKKKTIVIVIAINYKSTIGYMQLRKKFFFQLKLFGVSHFQYRYNQ